jgi:hypothetical protein
MAGKLARPERSAKSAWCIFDNTMFGAALINGIGLQTRLCNHMATVRQL